MSAKNDGGPAFPHLSFEEVTGSGYAVGPTYRGGMSLRDWFAGQALVAIMSGRQFSYDHSKEPTVANAAYKLADAMLAERETP